MREERNGRQEDLKNRETEKRSATDKREEKEEWLVE